MRIKIEQIPRVVGHLGFAGYLFDGKIKKAKIEIKEGLRLLEGILIDRHFEEAPIITARICGICPVVHNLTAIKAIESALGLKVSKEISLLRKLMLIAQIIHSHTLHLFFLSLPDFLNFKEDEINKIKRYPKETEFALRIRDFANKIIKTIGGRSIHPLSSVVGGFKRYPQKSELKFLLNQVKDVLEMAIYLANFFKKLRYPKFLREINFVSLFKDKEYAFYEGNIKISNLKVLSLDSFYKNLQELEEGKEKRVKYNKRVYFVGPLARINNSWKYLNPNAKKILKDIDKDNLRKNIFYNILAQAIEIVHFVEEVEKILKNLIKRDFHKFNFFYKLPLKENLKRGLGVSEAPRGLLFHYYEINKNGLIKNCNIITPTAQFLNDLEESLKLYLPEIKNLSKIERQQKIKMLVRAYDPCISCAVH
jgi:coenzyme F420-reducing hydrogenase alpha subunit